MSSSDGVHQVEIAAALLGPLLYHVAFEGTAVDPVDLGGAHHPARVGDLSLTDVADLLRPQVIVARRVNIDEQQRWSSSS